MSSAGFNSKKRLIVEAEGYNTVVVTISPDSVTAQSIITVQLTEKINELKEVTVRSDLQTFYKGDTLLINAEAIPTEPNGTAVELFDQLKEATNFGGKLRIGNNEIQRVYVDGKEIGTGNATSTILGSLRADMIKTVAVFQRYVEGQYVYVMDIRLNPDRQRGFYGSALAGSNGLTRHVFQGRASYITPTSLLEVQGGGSSVNTIYQQLTRGRKTPSLPLSIPRKAYSVAEAVQFTGQSTTYQAGNRLLNQYEPAIGDNQQRDAQVTFSKRIGSLTIDGGVSYERLSLVRQTINQTQLVLDSLNQRANSNQQDTTQLRVWRTNWLLNWQPSPQDQVRLYGDLTKEISDAVEKSDQFNQLVTQQDKRLLSETTVYHTMRTMTDVQAGTQALSWTHRFQKPAEVFSAFARYFPESGHFISTYQNVYRTPNGQLDNNQQTNRQVAGYGWEWQLKFAFPFLPKWLIEMSLQQRVDPYSVAQQGYRYAEQTGRYSIPVPALSVVAFRSKNEQRALQSLLVHRSANVRLVTGAALNELNLYRQVTTPVLTTTAWLLNPYTFSNLRTSKSTQITLLIKREQQPVDWDRLIPVIDSSAIISTISQNPYLTFVDTWSANLTFKLRSPADQELALSLQHEQTKNPVVSRLSFDRATGFSQLTFRQFATAQRSELALVGSAPQLTDALSLRAEARLGRTTSYGFIDEKPVLYTQDYGLFHTYLKWQPLTNFTVQADDQLSVTYQRDATLKQVGYNAANTARLTLTSRISQQIMVNLATSLSLLQYPASSLLVQTPQITLTCSAYLNRKKTIQTLLFINNPVGTAFTSYAYGDQNFLYQNQTRQMNPFGLLSVQYYFTVWQKSTRF